MFQSAPALCRAGDTACWPSPAVAPWFQSAPALCRAGDIKGERDDVARQSFNPRPLFAERATKQGRYHDDDCDVSIRARSLQSGRRRSAPRSSATTAFQSAPALCRAGDVERLVEFARGPDVSIRARSLQSGRPDCVFRKRIDCRSFNPRPLFAERATLPDRFGGGRSRSFNPRPLFAERATRCRASLGHQPRRCFNPRPLFAERATAKWRRPPARRRGFNPRPLFAERATKHFRHFRHERVVSIRARSLQSGRRVLLWRFAEGPRVSIRARSLQSGRRAAPLFCAGMSYVSIRARSLQSGRPSRTCGQGNRTSVSIRARSLQSGRLRAVKLLLRKLMDGISREPEWRQAMMTPQQDMRKSATK